MTVGCSVPLSLLKVGILGYVEMGLLLLGRELTEVFFPTFLGLVGYLF
jgi:hypothetical protein